MTRTLFLAAAVATLATAAAADAPKTFGKPLAGLKAVPLADVLAKPENGKTVRLEGTIERGLREQGLLARVQAGGEVGPRHVRELRLLRAEGLDRQAGRARGQGAS